MLYKKIDLHCTVFCKVSEEVAKEYIDYRIGKKKILTQGAFNRAMNQAAQCTCTPDEAIQITIDKGWDGVTPEYIAAELSRRFDAGFRASMPVKSITSQQTRGAVTQAELKDRSWVN